MCPRHHAARPVPRPSDTEAWLRRCGVRRNFTSVSQRFDRWARGRTRRTAARPGDGRRVGYDGVSGGVSDLENDG